MSSIKGLIRALKTDYSHVENEKNPCASYRKLMLHGIPSSTGDMLRFFLISWYVLLV
jgi:hypothetical protein